jgi:hypothetical protein
VSRWSPIQGLGALGIAALVVWVTFPTVYRIGASDRPFNQALRRALDKHAAIDLRALEPGAWTQVCGVGEGSPLERLKDADLATKPAPGETELTRFFDDGSASFLDEASSALVFVAADGTEVRPVSKLHILSGGALNVCVDRANAVLTPDRDGWRLGAPG